MPIFNDVAYNNPTAIFRPKEKDKRAHTVCTSRIVTTGFYAGPSTVSAIIHRVVPVLWRFFENQVSWPSIAEWNALRGIWPPFPDAVGCIDGTPREIYRPEVEPQWEFYSGHRHYHLMNTQLIVDSLGNIVFLQAGFLGSMNDAGNFHLM